MLVTTIRVSSLKRLAGIILIVCYPKRLLNNTKLRTEAFLTFLTTTILKDIQYRSLYRLV
jgi:hypothetical protein